MAKSSKKTGNLGIYIRAKMDSRREARALQKGPSSGKWRSGKDSKFDCFPCRTSMNRLMLVWYSVKDGGSDKVMASGLVKASSNITMKLP